MVWTCYIHNDCINAIDTAWKEILSATSYFPSIPYVLVCLMWSSNKVAVERCLSSREQLVKVSSNYFSCRIVDFLAGFVILSIHFFHVVISWDSTVLIISPCSARISFNMLYFELRIPMGAVYLGRTYFISHAVLTQLFVHNLHMDICPRCNAIFYFTNYRSLSLTSGNSSHSPKNSDSRPYLGPKCS